MTQQTTLIGTIAGELGERIDITWEPDGTVAAGGADAGIGSFDTFAAASEAAYAAWGRGWDWRDADVVAAARAHGARGGRANTAAQQAHRARVMGHGRPRLPEITRAQVEALCLEAGEAGDLAQVAISRRALDGSARAWRECQRVIREAQQRDEAGRLSGRCGA